MLLAMPQNDYYANNKIIENKGIIIAVAVKGDDLILIADSNKT